MHWVYVQLATQKCKLEHRVFVQELTNFVFVLFMHTLFSCPVILQGKILQFTHVHLKHIVDWLCHCRASEQLYICAHSVSTFMPTLTYVIVLLLFVALVVVAVVPVDIEFTLDWIYLLSWDLMVIPLTFHTYITHKHK